MAFFSRNVTSLLLSLGLSFTLWAVVVNQQNPDETRILEASIPVQVRNLPAGLVVQGVRDETVKLVITTTRDHWGILSPSSFRAYVDLANAEPGAREYRIQAESSDGRVRIEGVEPPQTEVRVSVQKRKTVPVRVNIVDNVPFGYEARTPTVSPDQVEIIGPQSLVESVATAVVDLTIGGARSSINQAFRPEPRDGAGKQVKGVEVSPSSVTVELPIEQLVAYKLVPVVPQIVGTVALGYQIVGVTPDPATVTVVGEPQALERLTQVSTQPIDVTNLSGDLHRTTEVVLPSGVSLTRKQTIVVRVAVNAIQGAQTVRVSPILRGASDDTEVAFTPGAVDITVSGPMPSLLQLRPQDFRAVVDVSGLARGTHVLSPEVSAPAGLTLEKVNPDKVIVTIK